jgi:hypothetical protein
MIPLKLRRKHLRAPLHTNFLYKVNHGVHKGVVQNISEGGLLLSGMNPSCAGDSFWIFFDLPEIANFSNMPISDILSLGTESFRHQIFEAEVEIKRKPVPGDSSSYIGCEFFKIDNLPQRKIKEYVSNYASNIVFTLSLFEQGVHRKDVKDLIYKSVSLLNYPRVEKLAELRQKLLHDYQSLESL